MIDLFHVAIPTRTRQKIAPTLQKHGLGLGLSIRQLRELYPAKAVRRTAILGALNDLDAMGNIEWSQHRIRLVGPIEIAPVFGEGRSRIRRDRALIPEQRGILDELSSSLVRKRDA